MDELTEYREDYENRCRPMRPIMVELGGAFYFKCGHIGCNNDVKSYHKFCYECGQKIEWEGTKI